MINFLCLCDDETQNGGFIISLSSDLNRSFRWTRKFWNLYDPILAALFRVKILNVNVEVLSQFSFQILMPSIHNLYALQSYQIGEIESTLLVAAAEMSCELHFFCILNNLSEVLRCW